MAIKVESGELIDDNNFNSVTGYRTEAGSGYLQGISHYCAICGLSFLEKQMREFNGRWYGIPCSCYKDIASKLKQELGGGY